MRECPRCGMPVERLVVARVDLTGRWALAFAVTGAFLVVDLVYYVLMWHYVLRYAEALFVVPVSAVARFLLAYALMWPRVLHAGHRPLREWKEEISLSLLIAAVAFMSLLIVRRIFNLFHPFMG